jgi:four helix bundle protein
MDGHSERRYLMQYIYERLEVWKKSVDFAISVLRTLAGADETDDNARIFDEIEVSAINIATSIAKGKACKSRDDFIFHLYLSRRSLYETMTLLEILRRNQIIPDDQYKEFEIKGQEITAMLVRLIRSMKESMQTSPIELRLATSR